jgi:hypothetical protein
MRSSKKTLLVLLIMLFSTTSFANVYIPTDGNFNLFTAVPGSNVFGFFDDSDDTLSSAVMAVNVAGMFGGATINFTKQGAPSQDWNIDSNQAVSGPGVLSNGPAFRIALWDDGGWLAAASEQSVAGDNDSWLFSYNTSSGQELLALGVDASPVPIPGAVWLMTFAFAGLFAFGRRKTD